MVWAMALTVALVKGIMATIARGPIEGLVHGALGFIIGAAIGAFWQTINKNITADDKNKFTAQIDFPLSPEQVFALCRDSLGAVRKFKLKYINSDEGKLIAKLPPTLDSWGETITFQVKKIPGLTSVLIESSLALPNVLYNYDNTKKIIEYLTELKKEK